MASNLRVDTILPSSGTNVAIGTASGTVSLIGDSNLSTSGNLTIGGNLGVGGVLTYEDVTNIDSVGFITARSGINISSGSLTIPDSIIHSGDINTKIRFPEADAVTIETNGSERLRIASSGQIGLGGANYGTSGQVLTSQGASSAPTWATPSGGIEVAAQFRLSSGYTIPENNRVTVVNNWEAVDTYGYGGLGSFAAPSSGVFTFPSTGIYHIQWSTYFLAGTGTSYENFITTTTDNNTYNIVARARAEAHDGGDYDNCHCFFLFDVTDVSTHKVKLDVYSRWASTQVRGSSDDNQTYVTFMRLGDT
tara:strand:- start:271 stop:1191 length:921 start_codon:yes stop_codon:yes gene_type:complete